MPAINYQLVDSGQIGAPGPGPTRLPIVGVKQWAVSQTWAAGDKVQCGAFLFSTVAGGAGAATGNGPSPQYLTDNACTWVLVGGISNLTVSDAVQAMDLGTILVGSDPNYGRGEFMYVKFTGSTAIVAGDWIAVERYSMTGTQATTTTRASVGIAMGSHALNVATPTYGWVMLRGIHTNGKANATCAINSTLYMLAAGAATTTSAAGTGINSAICKVAVANGQATFDLYWPMMNGTVA